MSTRLAKFVFLWIYWVFWNYLLEVTGFDHYLVGELIWAFYYYFFIFNYLDNKKCWNCILEMRLRAINWTLSLETFESKAFHVHLRRASVNWVYYTCTDSERAVKGRVIRRNPNWESMPPVLSISSTNANLHPKEFDKWSNSVTFQR